jgi:hypothetical protein
MTRIPGTAPVLTALIVMALTACAPATIRDERSPYSRIPVGSTVILNQPLEIPRYHARVFIQDGRVVSKSGLNQYYPHCNFEVRTVSDGAARIESDRFLVTGIRLDEVQVVRRPGPLLMASLVLVDGGEDGGGPPPTSRLVHYRLHSERQPDVMRLTCHGGMAEQWEVAYPSLAEIREVLGGIVTLEMQAGGG